jgi:hypothetical protein
MCAELLRDRSASSIQIVKNPKAKPISKERSAPRERMSWLIMAPCAMLVRVIQSTGTGFSLSVP